MTGRSPSKVPPDHYPVGIVGESHCQPAIRRCTGGQRVYIRHERNNPHDDLALRVETRNGERLGYIARTSWLRRAIHEEGRGTSAEILEIAPSDGGCVGVVLMVELTDDEVAERRYQPPPRGLLDRLYDALRLGG